MTLCNLDIRKFVLMLRFVALHFSQSSPWPVRLSRRKIVPELPSDDRKWWPICRELVNPSIVHDLLF